MYICVIFVATQSEAKCCKTEEWWQRHNFSIKEDKT